LCDGGRAATIAAMADDDVRIDAGTLNGIILMRIDARLELLLEALGEEGDDEEPDA